MLSIRFPRAARARAGGSFRLREGWIVLTAAIVLPSAARVSWRAAFSTSGSSGTIECGSHAMRGSSRADTGTCRGGPRAHCPHVAEDAEGCDPLGRPSVHPFAEVTQLSASGGVMCGGEQTLCFNVEPQRWPVSPERAEYLVAGARRRHKK